MPNPRITVVGLGPGSADLISLGAKAQLMAGVPVYFRTTVHPLVPELIQEIPGPVHSFDDIYESAEEFSKVYQQIVDKLLTAARETPIVYAVPGHPFVAETTVTLLLERAREAGVEVQVIPSMSGLEAMMAELAIDPTNGLVICDALEMPSGIDTQSPLLITQVYNRWVASDLKLFLLDHYDGEHPVTLVKAAGIPGQARQERMPLYQLDQVDWIDHLTSLYVPKVTDGEKIQTRFSLLPIVKVMQRLRAEDGCPWDSEQTHISLKPYLIEEAYEVAEAVDEGDDDQLMEELGDVLLQVIFHAQIAAERGAFDADDVVRVLVEKMIRRHPHVFGDIEAKTAQAVTVNWEEIKRRERAAKGETRSSVLQGIPPGLPALMTARKIQQKAAKVGFDWDEVQGAYAKVLEELREFEDVIARQGTAEKQGPEGGDPELTGEFGDILFALVNVARHLRFDPEIALLQSVNKFKRRFLYIEAKAKEQGRSLTEMTLEEMDQLWEEAKASEGGKESTLSTHSDNSR